MSRIIKPQPWLSQISKGTPVLVSCVSVLFASGPLARPCLDIFKQVREQAYILQERAHSLLQALDKSHQAHQAHTSPHKWSEARRWKVWASYPCVHLCLVFAVIYPEAIVASFFYLVGYRAHGGAIVGVFVSDLSMHKAEAGTRQ